ncbi:hypothetical protein DR999_PMT17868 [Platysternon megacephalum]|uniref:Uncharacterized protein n=1 Tax=Platysternon megacephalum TaxID=55544 RepID=A0A4D9DYG5_9SAUR|nr:hypothetical protein DR999_PMT17868 [Platysternon megacephalum]
MENEQLQVPPPSSSTSSTSTASSSSSSNGRQPGPQISVYSGIPDRQTVQVRTCRVWEEARLCCCRGAKEWAGSGGP